MDRTEQTVRDNFTIDISHTLKYIWRNVWVVIVAGVLTAAIGFSLSAFIIAPKYSSSILLYVNNGSIALDQIGINISPSDITAAQSLVKTYTVILKSRTTLESVIDKAGVEYTYEDLAGMISASNADGTEIMKITVTSENPYEAATLANCIAEVLPGRISEVIRGATMEVVDSAIPILQKISPSITKYTAVGLILGVLIAVTVLAILAMLDNTVHDEEYILSTYNYPILAKIPDLASSGSDKKYGYYYSSNTRI